MTFEHALQQLTAGRKAKRLLSLWPAIEEKLVEGVSHAQILRALNESGLELTERTYKSYLYRYRKRRRLSSHDPPAARIPDHAAAPLPDPMPVSEPCAPPAAHPRPPTFEFDPCGLSPDLLK